MLAACASVDTELRAARESWRGATYDELVTAWGPPARSAKDSHTWLFEDRPPRDSSQVGVGVGGALFGGSGQPVRCDRTVAFRAGRVADEKWTGDPEICKRFARRK